jgi:hypothetical protein
MWCAYAFAALALVSLPAASALEGLISRCSELGSP